jgi:TP901-1 family phage major tail protein
MAAGVGRAITFTWGSDSPAEEIPGVREKSIEISGEPIDISSDDSAGWRELLTVAGENQVTIGISGVTKNDALKVDWFAGTRTQTATITYEDGGVLTGQFFLASYSDTGTYNDANTFEADLQSTGVVTYTPAA